MASGPGPYQAQILDHYKHPHNRGTLDPATHAARESNPLCGDEISLTLRVDGSDRIEEVRFDGEGCAISMASASLLADGVKGKTLAEAGAAVTAEAIDERFGGLPPATRHGAELARDAVEALLSRAR